MGARFFPGGGAGGPGSAFHERASKVL
jgi:hypothetical protein